ncbi:MAG: hypothetical protein AB8B81_03370 [Halioglobus sp.]
MSKTHPQLTKNLLCLALLFALALVPRLYSALTVGWNWDYPGSFTFVNFDEGGSCRAALDGFEYSTFVGRQTIAITELLGYPVRADAQGDYSAAKHYCHSVEHLRVARVYSALSGSLTVVVLGVLALLLFPGKPQIAWTAAAMLALSGFHASESHSGTVDAPSVFFVYLFITCIVYARVSKNTLAVLASLPLFVAALWTKYWVFAAAAYLAFVPQGLWDKFSAGLSGLRLVLLFLGASLLAGLSTNLAFQSAGLYPCLALFYLLVPWRRISIAMSIVCVLTPVLAYVVAQIDFVAAYTTGAMEGKFGTGYAAIGWNKLIRNPVNSAAVLIVGIGLPACLFIFRGVRAILEDRESGPLWLCLVPLILFLAFMTFVSPITYYRHYLALIPLAALLAAAGLWSSAWSRRRWFLVLFFCWPALLLVDLQEDFHADPRIALRQWYSEHPDSNVFFGFYVSPPVSALDRSRFFQPEYAFDDAANLHAGDYLVLSENWYDTAFANELNGPRVDRLDRLIKTKPEYTRFYRQVLAGQNPSLQLDTAIDVRNFMPELVVHRWLYGNFPLFVGDLKIYRIVH